MTVLLGALAAGELPQFRTEAHEIAKRQVLEWFGFMDRTLDVHREKFLFREPSPKELAEHKEILKLAIRSCNQMHTVIADPDFDEPELVARLRIRMKQLQDAYDTFHDAELSDEKVDRVLNDVFPNESGT